MALRRRKITQGEKIATDRRQLRMTAINLRTIHDFFFIIIIVWRNGKNEVHINCNHHHYQSQLTTIAKNAVAIEVNKCMMYMHSKDEEKGSINWTDVKARGK